MTGVSVYSKNLANRIAKAINGVTIPIDDRSRVAGALFDIVHEHQQAVLLLIDKRIYGSAGALLRSVLESYVRGVWFMKCASDSDIKRFQKEKFKKGHFVERLEEIKKIDEDAHGGLLTLKAKGWAALNSYTHGGFRPVGRRFKGNEITANYDEKEIAEIECMVNAFAILAVFQIAEISKSSTLTHEAVKMATEFNEYYS